MLQNTSHSSLPFSLGTRNWAQLYLQHPRMAQKTHLGSPSSSCASLTRRLWWRGDGSQSRRHLVGQDPGHGYRWWSWRSRKCATSSKRRGIPRQVWIVMVRQSPLSVASLIWVVLDISLQVEMERKHASVYIVTPLSLSLKGGRRIRLMENIRNTWFLFVIFISFLWHVFPLFLLTPSQPTSGCDANGRQTPIAGSSSGITESAEEVVRLMEWERIGSVSVSCVGKPLLSIWWREWTGSCSHPRFRKWA